MNIRAMYLVPLAISLSTALGAEQPKNAESLDLSQIATMVLTEGGKTPSKPEANLPEFDEVTKGMKSREGFFTLWSYPPDAKDKDAEKLLCQIPSSLLGDKFMLSMSYSGGGFLTGFPLEERVVKWELLGEQLLLIAPETGYVAAENAPVSDVVRRTYPDSIRAAIPLVTKTAGGDPVIDLGAWLKSNFADIGWFIMDETGMPGGGTINASLSKWSKKKVFEQNVEIGVELAVASSSPPGAFEKKMVHYSFWGLPKSDYTPRVADERVGYFLTTNQDWAKPNDSRDIFNRYIDRWHLEKRDESLALCEPKQPIVYYIEKTVPIRFRRAVRDGILEWNKAFEKVGFSNAVEVRQQDDSDEETKNLDPEDMRYSFFRWIVTGAGFAMGPHRSNPFTGQIYDADIIFDDSMVRYFEQDASTNISGGLNSLYENDPSLQAFFEKFPEWRMPTRDWEQVQLGERSAPRIREAVQKRLRDRGCQSCDYNHGMKHQMAFGQSVLAGAPKEVVDKFLYDIIKEVVMHEVGHTLGLRHNFRASSIYTVEELKKRRTTGEAMTGSVMDYNPAIFFADGSLDGHFITPTIGPYDYWAIEYGYRPFDDSYKPESTKKESEGDKKKEDKKEEKKEKKPDARAVKTSGTSEGEKIPKEIMDQLPADVKAMIASGGATTAIVKAESGSKDDEKDEKSDESSFKSPPSGEAGMLQEIAGRSSRPELAYATDEDTTFMSPDPRSNRFDMASDPVAWAKERMELIDKRMGNILEWAVKDQESWYHLRGAFFSLFFERAYTLDYVGRYVGGVYFERTMRGASGAGTPFTVVEPAKQRAALEFIEQNLFSDKFFNVSPELLNHLAPPRWWHDGQDVSFTVDFPIHNVIAMLQRNQLFGRLFPNTLRRIHDAELKTTATDKVTAAEYLQRIQKGCWGQTTNPQSVSAKAWTDATPFVSSTQRSLQREYLSMMELIVRQQPGNMLSPDLHAMVQYSLQQLSNEIEAVQKTGKADFASQAHLTSCKSRIDRMLAPQLNERSPSMGMMISMD